MDAVMWVRPDDCYGWDEGFTPLDGVIHELLLEGHPAGRRLAGLVGYVERPDGDWSLCVGVGRAKVLPVLRRVS